MPGILCDDMGLGKTLQSICMLASDHRRLSGMIQVNSIKNVSLFYFNYPYQYQYQLSISIINLNGRWRYQCPVSGGVSHYSGRSLAGGGDQVRLQTTSQPVPLHWNTNSQSCSQSSGDVFWWLSQSNSKVIFVCEYQLILDCDKIELTSVDVI